MNGIETGNVFGNMAAVQQKNREEEMRNVRAGQNGRAETAKYGEAGRQTAGGDDGARWTRSGRGSTMSRPSWGAREKNNAPQQPRFAKGGETMQGEKENGGKQANAASSVRKADQSSQAAKEAQGQENRNNPAAQNSQNAKKMQGQENRNNPATQNSFAASHVGQTDSVNAVNRQRLMQQKKAKAKAKKKNLNYNRREISSQVLRANKIGSAARALASARTKVSSLRRCVGTGQYDENELRIAISHAESIVKTAKKKMANLKEESIKEKRVAREKESNALKKQAKKRRIRAQRQQIKREMSLQRSQMERRTKQKELCCKQLKRRHRGEELADVAEADIKYIKDMERYRRYGGAEGSGRSSADTAGTTALEIGDSAMRLSDLQRTEQALKYEEQQMQDAAATFYGSSASGSVDFLVGDGGFGGEISADAGAAAVDMAAVGASVDISL